MNTIDIALARTLGDRHLRPDLDRHLHLLDGNAWNVVRVIAAPEVAATVGGQHTLWMLVNLLARQFAVIHELQIAVPPLSVEPGVALFGESGNLAATLIGTARAVAGNAMRVYKADNLVRTPAAEVIVGRLEPQASTRFSIAALGSGWRAFAGRPDRAPTCAPTGRNSVGPYFAACVAAGEVFKHLRGLRDGRGRFVEALFLSLWDFRESDSWEGLSAGDWPAALDLPPFYLIGCGAVGQAVAAATAAADKVCGYATTIDGETNDRENLNRYPLATQADINNVAKSELTARFLRRGGLDACSYAGAWPGYAYDPSRLPQPEDIRDEEIEYRYPLILSCVDKNSARHGIQNFWPEFLMGGSTQGLAFEVNAYDMQSPYECLKCFNRPEPADPSDSEIVKGLLALDGNVRRALAEARGADYGVLEAYLSDPKCGQLGAAEIRKFRDDSVDWSVGFVSVAAGTALAAQLFKYALKGRSAFPLELGNSVRFNFLNPGLRWTKHLRRADCECTCAGRAEYRRLWLRHRWKRQYDASHDRRVG